MTQLGIFAKTFKRADVNSVCQAVKAHGFEVIQFNMACVGLPSMPDHIPKTIISEITQAVQSNGLTICGISGTFNMCHPDPAVIKTGLNRLEIMAKNCMALGTTLITLCTGTRDPQDKWKYHPDNHTKAAWLEMARSIEKALLITEQYDLQLGIEPELANVVNNASKAHRLLAEMKSERLKIVLDPANLFECADKKTIERLIDEAIELLAPSIIMAHAKDRDETGHFVAPGKGIIPFDYFVHQLHLAGVDQPMVAHGFSEWEVPFVTDFLKSLG